VITLLTSRKLAELLDCSERSLERRREDGDGPPYVKVGGAIRYPLSGLEKWLADNTRHSTSETVAGGDRTPQIKRRRVSVRQPRKDDNFLSCHPPPNPSRHHRRRRAGRGSTGKQRAGVLRFYRRPSNKSSVASIKIGG
jgi:hypothetical protein